jgi:hypothetical protein
MAKFRKKPVAIEALQFDGTNYTAIFDFMGHATGGRASASNPLQNKIFIRTLEGEMTADAGDWIIKGVMGEFYPCKPDIFAATYEPVVD